MHQHVECSRDGDHRIWKPKTKMRMGCSGCQAGRGRGWWEEDAGRVRGRRRKVEEEEGGIQSERSERGDPGGGGGGGGGGKPRHSDQSLVGAGPLEGYWRS